MSQSIIIKIRSVLAAARSVSTLGTIAILAMVFVLAVGSVQAAGDEKKQTVQSELYSRIWAQTCSSFSFCPFPSGIRWVLSPLKE